MTIIVSGNVLERKSARSQSVIAHIMSCSMEPKEYFLGRKIQMSRIKLEQTSPRRIQTLPPMPLLVMYMTLNLLKGCCQFQHLVYPVTCQGSPVTCQGSPVTCQLVVSIQQPFLRLRKSSLQFPIIVISYFLSMHMLKTIFGLVPN